MKKCWTLVKAAFALVAINSSAADIDDEILKAANSSLVLAAFTVTPDVTTSSLSFDGARSAEADVDLFSIGGGYTLDNTLYLEGTIGLSRYEHVLENSPLSKDDYNWNSYTATVGIGKDFILNEAQTWVFRPIANITIGKTYSDSFFKGSSSINTRELEKDIFGYGGSLMFAYQQFFGDSEIEFEARYSFMRLYALHSSSQLIEGDAYTNALSLWGRSRTKTDLHLFSQPLRWVFEGSVTDFLGQHQEATDVDFLMSAGTGIEMDLAKHQLIVHKLRVIGRYMQGEDIQGYSVSFAVSF